MDEKIIRGLYAATLTPRFVDGNINIPGLRRSIAFLLGKGISSFALNGATGEFHLTQPWQLNLLLKAVREAAGPDPQILCGVGAPDFARTAENCRIAEDFGVQGLLLPMPYFFRYEQGDLEEFCGRIAETVNTPTLLYNLPQFSSGIKKETAGTLIRKIPNIVGIKDSGGSLEILRYLTEQNVPACRIVGNDRILLLALREGTCDGVISGIAGVLPELIKYFFTHADQAGSHEFQRLQRFFDELIHRLNGFPVPWGLKWLNEVRGITEAVFPQPVSQHRLKQKLEFTEWFKRFWPKFELL